MKKFLLAGLASIALATSAHAGNLVRVWDAPIPVYQFDYGGGQSCGFSKQIDGKKITLWEFPNSTLRLVFENGRQWTSDGTARLTANGTAYTLKVHAKTVNGTGWLEANFPNEDVGRDFMHDLWNGADLTVDLGPTFQQTYALTGSAKTIVALHQCAASLPGFTPPSYGSPLAAPGTQTAGNMPAPVQPPLAPAVAPVTTGQPMSAEIVLGGSREARTIAVTINGIGPYRFLLDTGASDCSVPADVARYLVNHGALTGSARAGSANYHLADGSVQAAPVYRFQELSVGTPSGHGNAYVHNVTCGISPEGSDGLLGMAFLSLFDSFKIDNASGRLMLEWTE